MSWAGQFPDPITKPSFLTKLIPKKFKENIPNFGGMFGQIPKKSVIGKMGKMFKNMGGAFKEATGAHPAMMAAQGLLEVLRQMGILEPALEWLEGMFELIGSGALEALTPIMEKFASILGDPNFQEYLQAIGEVIAAFLIPTLEVLIFTMEAWIPLLPYLTVLLKGIALAITYVLNPLGFLIKLFYGGSPGLIPAFETLYAVGQPLLAILGFLIKGLFDLGAGLQGFLGKIMEAGQEIMEGVGGGVGAGVEAVGGFVSGELNFGQAIEGVANAVVGTFEDIGNAIAGLFGFAGGGIVTRPTVAKLGESGPEIISNVEQFKEIIGMASGGGGGITVNVEGSILNNDLIESIIREIEMKKGLGIL